MKTAVFKDFDAFSESVTDVDCVMSLCNPEFRTWAVCQAQLPRIHVQFGKLGSGNIVEGQSLHVGYLMYLPLSDRCEYKGNGEVISKGSFLILEPGCEFAISTADPHDWSSIFIPMGTLACPGGNIAPSDSGGGRSRVSKPDLYLARRFQSAISQLIGAASQNPGIEASPAGIALERVLLKIASCVLQIQPETRPNAGGRPRIPRAEIIRRCMEYLEEFHDRSICVSDLAAAAAVSKRTLRNVFHDYYGMGPARYLQVRQLNRVFRDLSESSPADSSVSEILLRNAVWEHGRFASRYRALFGEKPSTTLRSTRRRTRGFEGVSAGR